MEVIVGSVLSLLVMAVLHSFALTQHRTIAAGAAYAESQTVTRATMDLFAREVRMATYDPTDAALTTSPGPTCPGVEQGIVEATPSALHFQQDLDGDGLLGSPGESVRYSFVGDELRRADGLATPLVLAAGIPGGGVTFRYFDGSHPPIELVPGGSPPQLTPEERDCVTKVRLSVEAHVANPDPNESALVSMAESEVAIRNRSLTNF